MLVTVEELSAYSDIAPELISVEKLELANREIAAIISAYATYLDEDVESWPDDARVVALRVLARGFEQSGFVGLSSQQVTAGPFTQSIGISDMAASGAFYLSKQDKAILDSRGRRGGAYGVNLLPVETRIDGFPYGRESEWLWRGSTY